MYIYLGGRWEAVADYYTPMQLALKVGITEAQIAEFELKGLLRPTFKDGSRFFSSRQMYEVGLALQLARKEKVTLEKAFALVEGLRLRRVGATVN